MNKIIINRGSFKVDEVEFQQNTLTIGRSSDNNIPLDDSAVSGHHAKIVTVFKSFYIEDLNSTNGTLVNGKPVVKHTLHSGDVIAVGNHQLLFQSDEPASKSPEDETIVLQQGDIKQRLNEYIQAQEPGTNQANATNNVETDSAKTMASSAVSSPSPGVAQQMKHSDNRGGVYTRQELNNGLNSTADSEDHSAAEVDLKVNLPEDESSATKNETANPRSEFSGTQAVNPKATTLGKIPPTPQFKASGPDTGSSVDPNEATLVAKRSTDAAYLEQMRGVPHYLVDPKKKKSSIKSLLPILWAIIVAVLVIEIVYITYRSFT